ncbi:helix-turn-helix domain-containing protein [uncultured Subdoligranulum sp.]|uniref:helix-turn-helix domain-containing protein n=1 Tax=uncultured Subdoligranulum sp. TaxID=512298 RepID=UPI0025DA331F|nr:helix-turn-helix transcriptional regulator [uncultured Subdoligranulum sp.]
MDAKAFGQFLAETRRSRGLTQSALAEQLHVTDKAVSRWERGLGFPDINTLEPLAAALGLTLTQLMHADKGDGTPSNQSLEEFFTMLYPTRIDWRYVRIALFWCCIALAIWAQFTLPFWVNVHWQIQSDGVLVPNGRWPCFLVYLLCIGLNVLVTQIWKNVGHSNMSRAVLLWWRTFHPKLAPWVELGYQLPYAWLAFCPLFIEATILMFNG